jgi:hypothetical protein
MLIKPGTVMKLQPLPRLSKRSVAEHTIWLRKQSNAQRPPEAAAKLLVLVGVIFWRDEPLYMYGRRSLQDIATHLGISIASVNGLLSEYQGRGLLRRRIEVIPGNVEGQPDRVVQCHYVDPAGDLLHISLFGFSRVRSAASCTPRSDPPG